MSIINSIKLSEFSTKFWNKVKEKFNLTIINGRYDKPSKTLKLVKGGNTEVDVVLEGVVDKWSDLEHVIEYPYINEMDYTKKLIGKWYQDTSGIEQSNQYWSIYKHPVALNEQYTLLRKYPDSGRIVFHSENNSVIEVHELNRTNWVNGWYRQFITVPNNSDIANMGFCFQHGQNTIEDIILIKQGNVQETVPQIPYLGGAKIVIGEGVSTLSIKNINGQVPNGEGNIVLNANHFNDIYSKTESDAKYYACTTDQINDANDFKEFGIARTKSSTTNLPNVNRKYGVIQFFKENNNYGIQLYYPTDGDFKGTIWTRNIHNNTWSSWKRLATNEDISGIVKSINGQTPNAQGSVTINIDNITNLQNELDKKVEAWIDLKYAESIDGGNLLNKNKLVRGRYVAFANGTINTDSNWGVYWSDFYVKSGDTFIINKTDPTYAYYVWYVDKTGGRFERSNIVNGRFTVPNDERIVGFVLNVKIAENSEDTFMLYRGNTLPSSYEPYTGDYVLFSDKGFKFGFDNGGKTDLGDDLQTAVSALATRVMSSVVGELKTLAYDAGEQFEEGGRIWLRCDGQSLPIENYNEFYKHMRNVSEFTLPNKPDYGYLYICIE